MTGQHASTGDGEDDGLWARSEVLPNGSYGVAITYGKDWACVLTTSGAIAYAVACCDEATRIEYDAAVHRLMTNAGVPENEVVALIVDHLRPRRPPNTATAPLRFDPILGLRYGPHLDMYLQDRHVGGVTPHDLRSHGNDVLSVLSVTTLDSDLLAALTDAVGMTEPYARALIGSINNFWPRATTGNPQEVAQFGDDTES